MTRSLRALKSTRERIFRRERYAACEGTTFCTAAAYARAGATRTCGAAYRKVPNRLWGNRVTAIGTRCSSRYSTATDRFREIESRVQFLLLSWPELRQSSAIDSSGTVSEWRKGRQTPTGPKSESPDGCPLRGHEMARVLSPYSAVAMVEVETRREVDLSGHRITISGYAGAFEYHLPAYG